MPELRPKAKLVNMGINTDTGGTKTHKQMTAAIITMVARSKSEP
jgi:hypothetical protein